MIFRMLELGTSWKPPGVRDVAGAAAGAAGAPFVSAFGASAFFAEAPPERSDAEANGSGCAHSLWGLRYGSTGRVQAQKSNASIAVHT